MQRRQPLFDEGLFENTYVTGYAINTDAQALLMSSSTRRCSSVERPEAVAQVETQPKVRRLRLNPRWPCAKSPATPSWPSSPPAWAVVQAPVLQAMLLGLPTARRADHRGRDLSVQLRRKAAPAKR